MERVERETSRCILCFYKLSSYSEDRRLAPVIFFLKVSHVKIYVSRVRSLFLLFSNTGEALLLIPPVDCRGGTGSAHPSLPLNLFSLNQCYCVEKTTICFFINEKNVTS
jgi:hypothetical protein